MNNINNRVVYISFYNDINVDKVKSIMNICADIVSRRESDEIYFLFSSNGGLVDSAITLHNFLRALPVSIVMHNTGSVDSTANIVFLSAEKRYATCHASFLFHGLFWNFPPNATVTKNQMIESVSQLEISESKISGIITERTSLTTEEVNMLFKQGEAKNSAFALSKGIIHEIKEPIIPKDAPFISL